MAAQDNRPDVQQHSEARMPAMPRRGVLAAVLSALTVGVAGGAAWLGREALAERETVAFSRGTSWAAGEEARARAFLARAATDPRYEVVIYGHTGTQGDETANLDLSTTRAQLVASMAEAAGVPPQNITATGLGGADPLPKPSDQSDRSYQASLARTDIILVVRR